MSYRQQIVGGYFLLARPVHVRVAMKFAMQMFSL